jgi:hypothetical protein
MALEITSKNIQGIADLVICAPIKQGFIDAFENVTYETRLRLATDAFHQMRVVAREYELIKPFTDVAERIQSLLAFRIGIIDTHPQRTLFLAATFDRPWEPYMRLIWNPLGTFLDVLLCNCEGYVPATDNSFSDYAQWVRNHQVDSTIFYATTPLTVGDQLYLSKLERLQRVGGAKGKDLALAKLTADDPEVVARQVRQDALRNPKLRAEFLTMSTEALVALYRLADYYPPDRPQGEGRYLLRAAKDLFLGWNTTLPRQLPPPIRKPHEEMFRWLETPAPVTPEPPADPVFNAGEVQAGILTGYDRPGEPVKQGCLLLFGVSDAGKAREFIAAHLEQIAWEGADASHTGGVFINTAITFRGLSSLEVPRKNILSFPKEFREGMDERAGLLGDVHANHPRRWTLPPRFKCDGGKTQGEDSRATGLPSHVELSEIDIVMQLRTSKGGWEYFPVPNSESGLKTSGHPLAEAIWKMRDEAHKAGVTLLSIEPMRRIRADDPAAGPDQMQDHFGFLDVISQPTVQTGAEKTSRDDVTRGELLIGYANDRGDAPSPPDHFLDNGSFLVIRKLSQQVDELNKFLENPSGVSAVLHGDALLAKMMGRARDGTPSLPGATASSNDFDFTQDREATACPFQAHIRRANPRLSGVHQARPPFGRPTPRIMRRGMSYGSTLAEGPADAERGSMFMAYGASIAEQFEVIQRWINGGNSTGVAAAQNDPLIGVHPQSSPKTFRFVSGKKVARVDIPKPFVGLEWGLYLFVPSKTALTWIADSKPDPQPIGDRVHGAEIIQALSAMPADTQRLGWKTYLEDFSTKDPAERCDTPDVWAAIRYYHGGALRTPEGVLVASKALLEQVLTDKEMNYTVSGQAQRMQHSFGEIFIGLDPGPRYDAESSKTNALLMGVSKQTAFKVAHQAAAVVLQTILETSAKLSAQYQGCYPAEIDLRRDFITPTLAIVCNTWFGLPDPPTPLPPPEPVTETPYIVAGGWDWHSAAARKPRCPGDFMAPSRYCFYPNPTDAIVAYGIVQGQALRAAAKRYFDALRPSPDAPPTGLPKGLLTGPMFDAIEDNDLLSRTLIGVMTGALPPIDGNLRSVLYDWLKEKSLWRYQQALLIGDRDTFTWAVDELEEPMKRAMQKRPAPDLLWRTATKAHQLGNLIVQPDEMVILAIASATFDDLNNGKTDVFPVFGGDRHSQDHPTHACPAYDMAIGTMLGVLTALFEVGQIEALPAPLLVKLTGRPPAPAPTSPPEL